MGDAKELLVLTRDEMNQVIETAAKTAIETFNREREKLIKEQRSKRLHNTKLLLRIYRELKDHSDSSIYEISQISDEDVFDVLSCMTAGSDTGDLKIDSIRKSAARTRIIIEHIDCMLELYSKRCQKYGRQEECRRDRVIHAMFIDEPPMTAQEIAGIEKVDLRTVYKDVDAACEKLSAYIFGYYL